MKIYLKSGQIVNIDEVIEASYSIYEHGKYSETIDYVEYNKLDQPIFNRTKLLRDCQHAREDKEAINELISLYDSTGYLKFTVFMDQIVGIEED